MVTPLLGCDGRSALFLLRGFRADAKDIREMFTIAQTEERRGSYKNDSLEEVWTHRNPSLTTAKENYDNQYERQAQGQLPRD